MEAPPPKLSVVVPVLDEADGLPELHRRLASSVGSLEGGVEVVYVDDGSTDGSREAIERLAGESPLSVTLVRLSRNFGMEIAMSAALRHRPRCPPAADPPRPPEPPPAGAPHLPP